MPQPESSDVRMHPLDGVGRESLKITDLDVLVLSYRLKPEEQWPDGDDHYVIWKTTTVIVKLATDAGLVGIGGASRYNGPEQMKAYAEKVIKPFIVGRSPFDVEALAAAKCAHGAQGIWAAVDTAMWDLIGQAKGVPVCQLLATDLEPDLRVPVYASGGEYSWKPNGRFATPDDLYDEAVRHRDAGYKAFKFRLGAGFQRVGVSVDLYIEHLRRLREAVGPDFPLIQEANCRLSLEQCLELAPVLEELDFLWWEEPTSRQGADAIDSYRLIREQLPSVLVSGGEGQANRAGLAPWVDRGGYDIVQQGCDDAGMTEAWHMARMAHARGVLCCPHSWQGGMVAIANAHLMAGLPNSFLLESNMTPNPLKEGLFTEPLVVRDGYLEIPDRPGLGVTLRDNLEDEYPYIPGPWNLTEVELAEMD